MWRLPARLLRRLVRPLHRSQIDSIAYWQRRVEKLGARSVLNVGYQAHEVEAVTAAQRHLLFPLLTAMLSGSERLALDFGCGPGRFTSDLARAIDGHAVGVDPIPSLLALAPPSENVQYRLLERDFHIPLDDSSVHVLFSCLVLGGIVDVAMLRATLEEFKRVAADDCLVFVVENTSVAPDRPYWAFRSVEEYCRLLSFADIRPVGSYLERGNTITIMAGRTRG